MDNEGDKHVPKQLVPYLWKKGVSANPKGRPKGKTLKEFAREYLESLPDDEKVDYLASLPTEMVWQMAEGKPKSDDKLEVSVPNTLIELISGVTNKTTDTSLPGENKE